MNDRAPVPAPTSEAPSPVASPRSRLRKLALVLAWLLPPVLAGAAVLAHLQMHVPRSKMLPRPPDKQDRSKARKPKPPSARKDLVERNAMALGQLRAQYQDLPIADEPIDSAFRRNHDSLLRAIVHLARSKALPNEVVALNIKPACHTIRCELEVCGPTPAVDAIAALLPKIERTDGRLWHELRELEELDKPAKLEDPPADEDDVPPPKTKPKPEPSEPQSCRAWIVGFTVDGTRRSELRVLGYEDKPTPSKPTPAKLEPTPKLRDSTTNPTGPSQEPDDDLTREIVDVPTR